MPVRVGRRFQALVDGMDQFLVVDHQFMDPDPALVSGVSTNRASLGIRLVDRAVPTNRLGDDLRLPSFRLVGDAAFFADNCSIPMSVKWAMVPGASLVWSVLNKG
jgi:hypothetical protein